MNIMEFLPFCAPHHMKAFKTLTATDSAMLMTLCCVLALSLWVPRSEITTASEPVIATATTKIVAPTPTVTEAPALPDFSVYQDVSTKKRKFFNYLLPMIRQANDQVRAQRIVLLSIKEDLQDNLTLDEQTVDFVSQTAKYYRVPLQDDLLETVETLIYRVDIVPASLVLAQAANESGWGTSRFARKANNLFGVWCFTQGCGITPLSREEGLTHEVASYESVQHSVEAYMRTINTNAAYSELRLMRAQSRAEAQYVSGHELAEGLLRYSERGEDYVREIQQMIRVNNLKKFTLPIVEQV